MIKEYYWLTKPGIIYGNAITASAGFFLASHRQFDPKLFLAMLIGLSFVIAAACVFNNIFDADIDAKMQRTKSRSMVTHSVSKKSAIIYAIVLIILGVVCLYSFTTKAALFTVLVGFFV